MPEILLLNLVVFLGALVQGIIGFGLGVVSASIIFLINPEYLPVPLIMLSLVLTTIVLLLNRSELAIDLVRWPMVGQILGIVLAAWLVAWVDRSWFGFLFALLLLLAVFLTVCRIRLSITPVTGTMCGFASGFSGTIVAIGGPPMALLYHSLPPKVVIANLSTFFLLGCTISLVVLGLFGRVSWHDAALAGKLIPGMLLGYFVSRYVIQYAKPAMIRMMALSGSGMVGIYSLVKYGGELLAR